MKQRVRQELAFPAVVHFYSWLLHGACGIVTQHLVANPKLERKCHPAERWHSLLSCTSTLSCCTVRLSAGWRESDTLWSW